ncbi:hypothetical protein MMC22_002368 [Lobaria immixta]|nr:hypothetical protein [Lobaria immixta]
MDHSSTVSRLVKQVASLCKQADDVYADETLRAALLQATKQLAVVLEKPADAVYQNAFLPGQTMCVRVAIDLGLFELIVRHDSPKGRVSAEELAVRSQAEQLLIVRIMRVLAETGFVAEVGEETYAATPLTVQMCLPAYQGCIKHHFDFGAKTLIELPQYFRTHGYKCPKSTTAGPFQQAFSTDLPTFEYWATLPEAMQTFNTYMTGNNDSRSSWIDWYPVEERLLKGAKADANAVLMIDIAGGRGHYLAAFKERFPHVKGRLILQELPDVIDDAQGLDSSIERMKHDMFEPQPIKGARIYFFHFIFHDWPDHHCHKILTQIAAAMTPGYSKLILGEWVLRNTGTPLLAAGFDLQMMAMHSGMERSERQWRTLVEGAGLEVTKMSFPRGNGEGVVEAMRKEYTSHL